MGNIIPSDINVGAALNKSGVAGGEGENPVLRDAGPSGSLLADRARADNAGKPDEKTADNNLYRDPIDGSTFGSGSSASTDDDFLKPAQPVAHEYAAAVKPSAPTSYLDDHYGGPDGLGLPSNAGKTNHVGRVLKIVAIIVGVLLVIRIVIWPLLMNALAIKMLMSF
jgi:hypothetical protein